MARIAAVASALPEHRYPQEVLTAHLARLWADQPALVRRLEDLHANVQVRSRALAVPLEERGALEGFGQTNDAWIEAAVELAERAVRGALERAGLQPRDVDAIFFSTVTGLACPSVDARLANRLRFRPDLKRVPMFGLGCVAGAAGLARANDHLRGHPRGVALLVCVELCTLTFQEDDRTIANLIATGLFGDGAAAVVLVGEERDEPGPTVRATRSVFYPDSEQIMGWAISERGFRVVLSPAVPELVRERLRGDVDSFLADEGLSRARIDAWVCHPGGPKVLEAVADALEVGPRELALSWSLLAETGNLSSASVLCVLERTLAEGRLGAGAHALMMAMGPGFCSELVLLDSPRA